MGPLYAPRVLLSGSKAGPGAPQVTFWNVQQLMDIKRELAPALRRNRAKSATRDAYSAFGAGDASKTARTIQVRRQPRHQTQESNSGLCAVPRGFASRLTLPHTNHRGTWRTPQNVTQALSIQAQKRGAPGLPAAPQSLQAIQLWRERLSATWIQGAWSELPGVLFGNRRCCGQQTPELLALQQESRGLHSLLNHWPCTGMLLQCSMAEEPS